MGAAHLAELDFAERRLIEDDIDQVISEWTFDRDKWEIADQLQELGIAAAPVENLADTFEPHRGLGRSVLVVELGVREHPCVRFDQLERAGLAGDDHDAEAAKTILVRDTEHGVVHRWQHQRVGHRVLGHEVSQVLDVVVTARLREHDRAAEARWRRELDADLMAMGRVWQMLRNGAVRMLGEIGRQY